MKTEYSKRFRTKYKKVNNCHVWQSYCFDDGYGAFSISGKNKRAHRVSYELHKGKIPKGAFVCHTCDNPKCVNPKHLFLSTPKGNAEDCKRKGRTLTGIKNPSRKLTQKQVTYIRQNLQIPSSKLAAKFTVSISSIQRIKYRRSWK